jgi:hypothetical protein
MRLLVGLHRAVDLLGEMVVDVSTLPSPDSPEPAPFKEARHARVLGPPCAHGLMQSDVRVRRQHSGSSLPRPTCGRDRRYRRRI